MGHPTRPTMETGAPSLGGSIAIERPSAPIPLGCPVLGRVQTKRKAVPAHPAQGRGTDGCRESFPSPTVGRDNVTRKRAPFSRPTMGHPSRPTMGHPTRPTMETGAPSLGGSIGIERPSAPIPHKGGGPMVVVNRFRPPPLVEITSHGNGHHSLDQRWGTLLDQRWGTLLDQRWGTLLDERWGTRPLPELAKRRHLRYKSTSKTSAPAGTVRPQSPPRPTPKNLNEVQPC